MDLAQIAGSLGNINLESAVTLLKETLKNKEEIDSHPKTRAKKVIKKSLRKNTPHPSTITLILIHLKTQDSWI